MQKTIITLLLSITCLLSIAGCSKLHPYQPNIQQGNLLFETRVDELTPGMNKEQVVRLMGNPVLDNVFSHNHWAYVYTFQLHGRPQIVKKRVDVYFQNNRVVQIDKHF